MDRCVRCLGQPQPSTAKLGGSRNVFSLSSQGRKAGVTVWAGVAPSGRSGRVISTPLPTLECDFDAGALGSWPHGFRPCLCLHAIFPSAASLGLLLSVSDENIASEFGPDLIQDDVVSRSS